MGFYMPLLRTAAEITWLWAKDYLLFPWVLIGVGFSITPMVVFEYWWWHRRMSRVIWHVLRILVETGIGLFATIGVMFAISLLYYAPPVVMHEAVAKAQGAATLQARKQYRGQIEHLTAQVSYLQARLRSDPLASKLREAESERDDARREASEARDFANRLGAAAGKVVDAEDTFAKAYDRQGEQWAVFWGLSTGSIALKPDVSQEEASAELHEYEKRKADTKAALRKFHEQFENLRIILQEGY